MGTHKKFADRVHPFLLFASFFLPPSLTNFPIFLPLLIFQPNPTSVKLPPFSVNLPCIFPLWFLVSVNLPHLFPSPPFLHKSTQILLLSHPPPQHFTHLTFAAVLTYLPPPLLLSSPSPHPWYSTHPYLCSSPQLCPTLGLDLHLCRSLYPPSLGTTFPSSLGIHSFHSAQFQTLQRGRRYSFKPSTRGNNHGDSRAVCLFLGFQVSIQYDIWNKLLILMMCACVYIPACMWVCGGWVRSSVTEHVLLHAEDPKYLFPY